MQNKQQSDLSSTVTTGMIARRNFAQLSTMSLVGFLPSIATAAGKEESSLQPHLYTILRVREATEQETRLINTGKFKDVQRANVKLAVRFMVQNYRLSDNFIKASAFLKDQKKRVEAGEIGQSVVQALFTILEYFDAQDVQNLRVGQFDNMAGKEYLVLQGLDAARKGIDNFLAYFPTEEVEKAKAIIAEENALNEKEFDPELGVIVNLKPKS